MYEAKTNQTNQLRNVGQKMLGHEIIEPSKIGANNKPTRCIGRYRSFDWNEIWDEHGLEEPTAMVGKVL